ncbi:MAG TPA: efflux RND transporter periplasmic adaptor subunit [Patescibacteria group bacterium]|nr:efflux RND transporter periplasmic adaptor subunit [Patescibacteria group bacterium]
MNFIKNIFIRIKNLGIIKKIILVIVIAIIAFFVFRSLTASKSATQYQTAQVTRGTLVVSLTEAGQVSVANKVSIVTQASGIVSNVYVKSGQTVSAGDKIVDVTLDTAGQQRQAQAYSSLLSAQNSLQGASTQLYTLQNQEFVANQKFINDKGIPNPTDTDKLDPVYIEENAAWLAAEATYKNQSNVISQSQANLNNASLAYQLTSGTIIAPTAGTVGDLIITKGMQIGSSNTTAGSSTNTSNQAIASIITGNATTVSVSVAEVDAPQIKIGQAATITFDALPSKTFTGKVMGINTTGAVTSGVTTYPAVIQLDDTTDASIFPNMSATANIITKVDDNVLLVPSAAVQTVGTASTVRVLKNGQVSTVTVQAGDMSDSQTVITSGLSEGDTVVTSAISTTTTTSNTTSPFSGGLRLGGFGGGGGGTTRAATSATGR